MIDIQKHMVDAGDQPVPWKPQLVRGGCIFKCPICGKTVNSHHYRWYSAFEEACREHMLEHGANVVTLPDGTVIKKAEVSARQCDDCHGIFAGLGYYIKCKNETVGDILCPHCIATLYPKVKELYGDPRPKLVEIFHLEDEHLTAVNHNLPVWVIGVVHPERGRIKVGGCRNWETWIDTRKSGREQKRMGRLYWADCKKCPDHVHGLFGFHFCKGELCHELND